MHVQRLAAALGHRNRNEASFILHAAGIEPRHPRQAQHRLGKRQFVLCRRRGLFKYLRVVLPEALDQRQVCLSQRAELRLGIELAEFVDVVALAAVVAAGELAQIVRLIEIVAPGARIVEMEVRIAQQQSRRLLARHNGELKRDTLLHTVILDGAERRILVPFGA